MREEEVGFGNSPWATPSAVAEHITHSWDQDNSQHRAQQVHTVQQAHTV